MNRLNIKVGSRIYLCDGSGSLMVTPTGLKDCGNIVTHKDSFIKIEYRIVATGLKYLNDIADNPYAWTQSFKINSDVNFVCPYGFNTLTLLSSVNGKDLGLPYTVADDENIIFLTLCSFIHFNNDNKPPTLLS